MSVKIENETYLDFDDVLIKPKSSPLPNRSHISLYRNFTFTNTRRGLCCVPIMAANMDTTGTFEIAQVLCKRKWITCLRKHYHLTQLHEFYDTLEDQQKDLVWYSMGVKDEEIQKLRDFIKFGYTPNVCVDVANGYTDYFVDQVKKIRDVIGVYGILMAGNVATYDLVDRILRQGNADIVKIGIGPGANCTTRIVTGIGIPQLSAVMQCSDAAHGSQNGFICSDGGCKYSGDVVKAFGADADFVMLGSLLVGVNESYGAWSYNNSHLCYGQYVDVLNAFPDIEYADKTKLTFTHYGMSSYIAKEKNGGGGERRASEGKISFVDYKGSLDDVCNQIEGGIVGACSMIGASSIKNIGKCTTFIKVNQTHNTRFSGKEEFKI